MADYATSAFAERNRMLKAVALDTALSLAEVSADGARALSPAERRGWEKLAGIRPCSDATWTVVAQLLADAEQSSARRGGAS